MKKNKNNDILVSDMPKAGHIHEEAGETCQEECFHHWVVAGVKDNLVDHEDLQRMTVMFKAMSDPTRLRLINALILSELCVCDLTQVMEMTQPAVSHHLRALRQARLIKSRRQGKQVYYSMDDEHICLLFNQCLIHAREER